MANGFKAPFSGSVSVTSKAVTFRSVASVPAGAFQTPRSLSVRAHTPAIVPLAPMDFRRKSSNGSGIKTLGKYKAA